MLTEFSLRGGRVTNPAANSAIVRTVRLDQDTQLEERALLSGVVLAGREWTVTSTDQAGTSWSNSTLIFTTQTDTPSGGLQLEGHFDWLRNGTAAGRELFRGTLSADRGLTLQGYQVTSPSIATATYTARLDAAGNAFTNGAWTGFNVIPGTWSAVAPPTPVASPSLRIVEGSPNQSAPQQQTFRITTANTLGVRMPDLTFVLRDLPAGTVPSSLVVTWTTSVQYRTGTDTPPGAKAVPGFSFTVTRLGTQYQPAWPSIRGGELDVTARFTVAGRAYTVSSEASFDTRGLQILGSNPTKAQVQAYINSFRPPANWPANSGYDYNSILRRIAYHETNLGTMGSGGYNQFYRAGRFAGHPTWNTGGDGGVGVMQVTTNPVNAANVWDWRANIGAAVAIFNDKLRVAATYPQTIKTFASFTSAVERYNQARVARGLQPLVRVDVPAWTPQQRVLVAIRAYNGAAGTDSIGTRILNEYELATTGTGSNRQLALQVNETTRVGTAQWVRVPVARRTAGEPNYVQLVLASPDN